MTELDTNLRNALSFLDFKKGENLPELYEYLGSLDNGDTELESKGIPPSLFGNEQQRHMHQSIDQMKLALAEEEIGGYLEEFEKQVEEEVLMIGSIGLEEVQVKNFSCIKVSFKQFQGLFFHIKHIFTICIQRV